MDTSLILGCSRVGVGRAEQRRFEALIRNQTYAQLSPEDKLLKLDQQLGPGRGATRQRERLEGMILERRNARDRSRPGVIVGFFDPDTGLLVAPPLESK